MTTTTRAICLLAFIALAASCGNARTRAQHGVAAKRPAPVAELFPGTEPWLIKARPVELLPADTLAVAVIPSMRALHAPALRNSINQPLRHGLGALCSQILGHDLLDLDHLAATGIDTGAPAALALLDAHTAALVMRVVDASAFRAAWTDSDERSVSMRRGHAVIAFAVQADFDASDPMVLDAMTIEGDDSLATVSRFRQVAADLSFAPDLALFVNIELLRRAVRSYLQDQQDELEELDNLAEDMEIEAVAGEDADDFGNGAKDSWDPDSEPHKLEQRIRLFDTILGAAHGVAVGVGMSPDAIKLQAVVGLHRAADPTATVAHTARGDRGISLATRITPGHVTTLLSVFVSWQDLDAIQAIIAALGGTRILDGAVMVSASGAARSAHQPAQHVHNVDVRLGVRDADALRPRLEALMTAWQQRPGGGPGALPSPWRARLDSGDLVLQLGTRLHRSGARSSPDHDLVRALLAMPGASATGFASGANILDIFVSGPITGPGDLAGNAGAAAAEGPLDLGLIGADEDQYAEFAELASRRRGLELARDERLRKARGDLARMLGPAAGAAISRKSNLIVYAAQTTPKHPAAALAMRGLRSWFDSSVYSPEGKKMAALDEDITRLRVEVGENMSGLLDSSASAGVLSGVLSQGSGGVNTGGVIGGVISGSVGGLGLSGSDGTSAGSGNMPLRVTASITKVNADKDTAGGNGGANNAARELVPAMDQALLGQVADLRRCYGDHRSNHSDARGYMTVVLRVDQGRVRVVQAGAAPSAVGLHDAAFKTCIAVSLGRMEVRARWAGTVTATLWFGD